MIREKLQAERDQVDGKFIGYAGGASGGDIMHNALSRGAENVLLLALWDGRAGNGPGGTKDMTERARKQGARTEIISALSLKDL